MKTTKWEVLIVDGRRFDALSRTIAIRRSRRDAVRNMGLGGAAAGVLAALGVRGASAATKSCSLDIVATTSVGPSKKVAYEGTLNLEIGEDGAVDDGSFDTK